MQYITQIGTSFKRNGGAERIFRMFSSHKIFTGDIQFRQSICVNPESYDKEFCDSFSHPVYLGTYEDVRKAIKNDDIILFWTDHKLNESNLPKPKIGLLWACWEEPRIIQNNNEYITHCVAISKKIVNVMCRDKPTKIIYPNVDYEKLQLYHTKEDFKRKHNFKESDFIIGMIARIGENKRHIWLMNALKKIKNKNIKAVFVGEGNLKKRLESLNVPNCHFVGHHEKVGDWYNIFDAFCVLSPNEGGPLTMFESFYMNVPFIHTPVGLTEEFCNCTNSFMVKNTKQLIDVIKFLYEMKPENRRLYTMNNKEITEKYSNHDTIAKNWYDFLKNISQENKRRLL